MIFNSNPMYILYVAITIIIWITVHEFAHAYTSYKLGDITPEKQWRVNLNPINHIDPLWFLLIFVIWLWWGKPVMINPNYYKNWVIDELKVALAWPISNILLAMASIIFIALWININNIELWNFFVTTFGSFMKVFIFTNLWLAFFNLLPIPPLDWFTIIKTFNESFANKILSFQNMIIPAFFVIIILLWPILWNIISFLSSSLFNILFTIFNWIFKFL